MCRDAVQNNKMCESSGLTDAELKAIIASVTVVVLGSSIVAIVILVKSRTLRELSDSDPMMAKIKAAKEKKKQKRDSQQQKLVEAGAAAQKEDTEVTEVQDISQPAADSSSSIHVPTEPESESHILKSKPSSPPEPTQQQQYVAQNVPRTTDSQHDATAVQEFEPEEDNDEVPRPNDDDDDDKPKQIENIV